MPNDKNMTPEQELQALKAENKKLKARNADLYRDCVAFAKLIKAGAKKEEQIDELQKEIIMLRSQVETLKQTSYSNFTPSYKAEPEPQYEDISSNTYANEDVITNTSDDIVNDSMDNTVQDTVQDTVTYNPRIHYIDQETFEQQNMDNLDSIADTKPKKEKKPKTKKAAGQHKAPRIAVSVLLAFSIFVTVISGISYLFSTTYKDYTVMGYRFAAVRNNAMMPEIDTGDAVLIKYCTFEGLAIDSLIVTTKDSRSLARITDLAVSDGVAVATVQDKTGSYEISANEFVGKVTMTIPLLGSIVHYASANAYNYMAIVVSINLFLVACLLLIPDDKPKKAKFGKDYTAEEFTI